MTATLVPPATAAPDAPATAPSRTRSERHQTRRLTREALPPGRYMVSVIGLSVFVLAGWSVLYVLVFSSIQHDRAQHRLYATFRYQLAQGLVPIGGVIAEGTPIATISIAGAGLHNEVVVEGTSAGDLRDGPGHLRTTAMPGQPGTSVLFGRSVAYGGPFSGIPELQPGTKISVTTGQGAFTYRVTDVRHQGDPVPTPLGGTGSRLTLVTSQSSGWLSGLAPGRAVIADATLSGASLPDPGGRLAQVPASNQIMANDSSSATLMQLVLWLQLLAMAGCIVAWLSRRWLGWSLWLVSVPVIVAVLWGLSNTAVRLLPNLL